MLKRMLLVLLIATVCGGAAAQDPMPTASVLMVPFTEPTYGITGLAPNGWDGFTAGIWVRLEPPQTLLAQQGIIGDFNQIVGALLEQLGIAELPDPDGGLTANGLDWVLYSTEGPAGMNIMVDFAISRKDASIYLILLQSDAGERDALREQVFLPAVNALAPIDPAPVVPDDADYTAENVTFDSGDIVLAGTLTLPAGDGPHPAVILVSGSGPQDRDESTGFGLQPFALIADHFARSGIATLRYDDRGYGRSGGDYLSATIADFADDAEAALAYLQTRPEVDSAQFGVLGHSEGGVVAAHLAERGAPVAFYVLMAGSAVNGSDILIRQNERIYAAEGLDEEAAAEQIAFITEMFPLVLNGDTAGMAFLLDQRVREQVAALTEEQRAQITDIEAFIQETVRKQLDDFGRSWWPYFLRYDPAAAWETVTVPVLAIFGALDTQVDAEQNAAALRAALEESPAADEFEIVTLSNANHLFQHAISGAVSEYGMLRQEFDEEFLPTITEWILEHVTLPE